MPRTRLDSRVPRRHGTVASPLKLPNRGAMLKSLAQAARKDAFGGAADAKIALHTRKADGRGARGAAALEAFVKNRPSVQPAGQATVGTAPAPASPPPLSTTPTPPPAAGSTSPVSLVGNDHVRTFDGRHDVAATGNRNRLTITGHSPELRLTGNENSVVITGTVDRIVVSGNNNRITWPVGQPAPTIVQAGLGNSLGEG
ncbi:MAG: DUF3060 domain-containing protein [Myxococcales bacterium]|nr:DUF3060 domain-containing protein [Myxococcales bacterium]MDP3504078.1 DUF3060 domain-containing protein [Myxococcales bacterium]